LHEDRVAAEEVRCAGQPHGFLNFGFPGAGQASAQPAAPDTESHVAPRRFLLSPGGVPW
jgi:hypothetical protein